MSAVHASMIAETSLSVFDSGMHVRGKHWRWEDGRLELVDTPEGVRLAPERVIAGAPRVLRRWPVIPPERVEAVRLALAEKQPTTDSTDDTDRTTSVQSASSVVNSDPPSGAQRR